jgi:hypothetical protein
MFKYARHKISIVLDASLIQINPNIVYANLTDSSLSLDCNYAGSNQVIWIKTVAKENLFHVNYTDRVFLTSNGSILNILNLTLADEEYYGCGYTSNNGEFYLMNAFYVYVKIKPQIEFITEFVNDVSRSLQITCIALNAKPHTYLAINDADSMFPISTKMTNSETKYCNDANLCTLMHQVEIQMDALPNFLSSKDYTCSALSTISNIESLVTKTITINFNSTLSGGNFKLFTYFIKFDWIPQFF